MAARRSSTGTQEGAPSTVEQVASEISDSTPRATVSSGPRVSSSWTPPRISRRPTSAVGSSSRSTAAAADICDRIWYDPGCTARMRSSASAASRNAPTLATTSAARRVRPIAAVESPSATWTTTSPCPGPV
jgi:hypothetical protein